VNQSHAVAMLYTPGASLVTCDYKGQDQSRYGKENTKVQKGKENSQDVVMETAAALILIEPLALILQGLS